MTELEDALFIVVVVAKMFVDAASIHMIHLRFLYAKSHLGTTYYREGISTNVLHQVDLQKSAPKLGKDTQVLNIEYL